MFQAELLFSMSAFGVVNEILVYCQDISLRFSV